MKEIGLTVENGVVAVQFWGPDSIAMVPESGATVIIKSVNLKRLQPVVLTATNSTTVEVTYFSCTIKWQNLCITTNRIISQHLISIVSSFA